MLNKKNLLYLGTIVTSIIYILWRIFFSIPLNYGYISLIFGIALLIAEMSGIIETLQSYYGMGKSIKPKKPQISADKYPDIDVFISTYNETAELLYKTVNGCLNMDYPDKSKVHIYICDDGDRAEIRKFSEEMGVGYLRRDTHEHAKAGNLNHAMSATTSPLVATFDADMIPLHNFLMEIVPLFFLPDMEQDEDGTWRERKVIDENFKIGFIQAPQSFYNSDLFQYNLYSEQTVPNEQDYFYRDVQLARNATNSAIYGGSNTIISRKALDEIGGFFTGVITEDFATGIYIQSKGYTCYAIDDILAIGLAPTDLKSLIKQRERWGRGCIQTVRKIKILTIKGLSLGQKLSYMASYNYWYTPFRRFLYLVSPILFSVFNITVVQCSLQDICIFWLPQYIISSMALKSLSGNIRNNRLSNIYDTILFPSLLVAVLLETVGIKKIKFAVTKKEKVDNPMKYHLTQMIPHVILAFLSCIGIVNCLKSIIGQNSIASIVILFWLVVNLYNLIMSIFFMRGRKNYRTAERFSVVADISIGYENVEIKAKTLDISDDGFAVVSKFPEYIPYGKECNINLIEGNDSCNMKAEIVHTSQVKSGWKYAFKITKIDDENKKKYFSIIYDREPSLPSEIVPSISVFEDIQANLIRYSLKDKRKLARITLNKKLKLLDGAQIVIKDFNYEHILIGDIDGMLGKFVTIPIIDDLKLDCIRENYSNISRKRRNDASRRNDVDKLYIISNYEQVAKDIRFKDLLLQWMDEYERLEGKKSK